MARLLNILIISSEVINVGEDAERRGSVLLVGERDDARLTFLFDPALGRRFALELSDDSRLRVYLLALPYRFPPKINILLQSYAFLLKEARIFGKMFEL